MGLEVGVADDLKIGVRANAGYNAYIYLSKLPKTRGNSCGDFLSKELFIEKRINSIAIDGLFRHTRSLQLRYYGDLGGVEDDVLSVGVNIYICMGKLKLGTGFSYTTVPNTINFIAIKPIILKFDIGLVKKKNKK